MYRTRGLSEEIRVEIVSGESSGSEVMWTAITQVQYLGRWHQQHLYDASFNKCIAVLNVIGVYENAKFQALKVIILQNIMHLIY